MKRYSFLLLALFAASLCFADLLTSQSDLSKIFKAFLLAFNLCGAVYWIKEIKSND